MMLNFVVKYGSFPVLWQWLLINTYTMDFKFMYTVVTHSAFYRHKVCHSYMELRTIHRSVLKLNTSRASSGRRSEVPSPPKTLPSCCCHSTSSISHLEMFHINMSCWHENGAPSWQNYFSKFPHPRLSPSIDSIFWFPGNSFYLIFFHF